MSISTDPVPQIQMIRDYLQQGVRLNGSAYIDQQGAKDALRNIVTHLDFRQRQSIEDGFNGTSPDIYFKFVTDILDLIDEFKTTYPQLELTEAEKQGLINVLEDRILNQFGGPLVP